ncbi:potassium transporter TrkA [Micromonospora sp. NPDC018662]|uniref:potassium transporter TrkA n=1 Tax=Micromonospora sp. NPDC018662 TaxID=3364238 RepID=UPI0037B2ED5E
MSAPPGDASRHVVVVGGGRLARALCDSLAAIHTPVRLRVTVLARDPGAANRLARGAQVRATVAGTAVGFTARPFTPSTTDPGRGYAADAASMARLRPDVLVCAASAQSPYERTHAPSAWTELVTAAGFGVTLALQAELVSRLAAALAAGAPDASLVNAAFPDAVNPLLAAAGRPVLCGIGNVATLAACLDAALGGPGPRRLAVLGHHAHLAAPDPAAADDTAEVRAWLDGREVPNVTPLLAGYRALPRPELNALAGHAGAAVVAALAAGMDEVVANLPGPLGLPGGYPVRLRDGRAELRLPAGVDVAHASAWNTAAGRRDGVEVDDGHVRYPERARAALAAYRPDLAGGWHAGELPEVFARFTALRDHLRTVPPAPARARSVWEEARCP